MARKQKANEVTVIATSKVESLAQMVKFTRARIEGEIDRAREEIAKWAQETIDSKGEMATVVLLDKLRWAERIAYRAAFAQSHEVVMRVYAKRIEQGDDEATALYTALDSEVKRVSDYLLRNGFSGGSSSEFANATEHTRRAAASQFYKDLGGFVEAMKSAIEAAREETIAATANAAE